MSGFPITMELKLAINDFLKIVLANAGYSGMQLTEKGDEFEIEIYVKDKLSVEGQRGSRIRRLRYEILRTFGIGRLSLIVVKYPPYGMCAASLASHAFYERLGIRGFQPILSVKWLINDYLNQTMVHAGYRGMKMVQNGMKFSIEIYVEDKRGVVGPHLQRLKKIIRRRFQIHQFSLRVEQYPPKGLCAESQVRFLQRSFLADNMRINALADLAKACSQSLQFMQKAGALGCEICVRLDSRAYIFTAGNPIVVDTDDHPDIDWATNTVRLQAFWCFIAVRILRPKISALTTDWDRLGSDSDHNTPTLTIYDL